MHTQTMDFEFDPAKAKANLLKHKVSFRMLNRRFAMLVPSQLKTQTPTASPDLSPWVWTLSGAFWWSSTHHVGIEPA